MKDHTTVLCSVSKTVTEGYESTAFAVDSSIVMALVQAITTMSSANAEESKARAEAARARAEVARAEAAEVKARTEVKARASSMEEEEA